MNGAPESVFHSRTAICNSRNCSGDTSLGAPMSGSCAFWFIGKAMTSRMFGSSASSMTMRSMPGAMPPWGASAVAQGADHAPELVIDFPLRMSGNLKRLVHDVWSVIADGTARQFRGRCRRCRTDTP